MPLSLSHVLGLGAQNLGPQVVCLEEHVGDHREKDMVEAARKDREASQERHLDAVRDGVLIEQRDDVVLATHDSIHDVYTITKPCKSDDRSLATYMNRADYRLASERARERTYRVD